MTLPPISAICVTYGRPQRLREALACFLAQQYDGQKELLIYNTYPAQVFVCDLPGVVVVNCAERPPSLGAARNSAIRASTGDWLVTWDDDDLYLPHHLQVFGETACQTNADWIRLDAVYFSEKWRITKDLAAWANAVAFKRAVFEKVGGYSPTLSCGEDRQFVGKISTAGMGATVNMRPRKLSAIYCWNNAVHHISGAGDDRPGKSCYADAAKALERRARTGVLARGEIKLTPVLEHDPVKMAAAFHKERVIVQKTRRVCIVELGRFGDIINILPIARHIHETYATPHIMVSREFASVLDGVSYAIPYPVNMPYDRVTEAMKVAEREFDHVILAQIWGKEYRIMPQTPAFNMESWRQCGFLHKWADPAWVPLFDRTNPDAAAAICKKLFLTDKPKLLLNLTRSVSSPFPKGATFIEPIRERFGAELEIVDISCLILPHIYDLLELFNRAAVLVSTDTALVHLAPATGIATVALVPNAWRGAVVRGNCVARLYHDIATPASVIEAIARALDIGHRKPGLISELATPPVRRLFHICERHIERNPKEFARKARAQKSWTALYSQGVIPAYYERYKRTALEIGDKRDLPYLKDALAVGLDQAGDEDIVFWTNDDNYLHHELPEMLRYHVGLYEVCVSQRCEFRQAHVPVNGSPKRWATDGGMHMGRDLFAATGRWLRAHWNDLPDFLLGASDFDLCLACMVRLHFGIQTDRWNIERNIFPAELPRGLIAHEWHKSKWTALDNVDAAPSQKHNRALFRAWGERFLPSLPFGANNTI